MKKPRKITKSAENTNLPRIPIESVEGHTAYLVPKQALTVGALADLRLVDRPRPRRLSASTQKIGVAAVLLLVSADHSRPF